jgi:folate-binding protein YgfZ
MILSYLKDVERSRGLPRISRVSAPAAIELDGQYRQLREECGLVDRSRRGKLLVRGADAAEYLQGQLTNDVEALTPGQGCYAALLDRKGHLQSDMRVLRLAPGEIWIDVEEPALEPVSRHLDTYRIGREVELSDLSAERALVSLVGPRSEEVAGVARTTEHGHGEARVGEVEALAVATAGGIDLICAAAEATALRDELQARGAVEVSEEAAEILRVESGRPRFGAEMTSATMPAEAGIVDAAVSFTKGCYIGQEPVARLHYKGRPNRHLRGLRLSGPARGGDVLRLDGKEVGAVGTACLSPALGRIGLAIVRREAEPGSTVAVGEDGTSAEVVELPFERDA